MSFQKLKSDSYCVGGRHRSATTNVVGDISIIKKTGKEVKLLVGKCVICDRKKTMIVSDNVIKSEGLGDFSKIKVKKDLMYQKRWQKMYSKILAELWILQRTLLQKQLLKILKM